MSNEFKDYLKAQPITDTPEGDFIEDALRDRDFPDVKSLDQLERYLRRCGAIPEAIAAARVVWGSYLDECGGDIDYEHAPDEATEAHHAEWLGRMDIEHS